MVHDQDLGGDDVLSTWAIIGGVMFCLFLLSLGVGALLEKFSSPTETAGIDQFDLTTVQTVTVDIRNQRAAIKIAGVGTPLKLFAAQDFIGTAMWPFDESPDLKRGRVVLAISQSNDHPGRWVLRRWRVVEREPTGELSSLTYRSEPEPSDGWPVFRWSAPIHAVRVPDPLAEPVVYERVAGQVVRDSPH